jgi:hypothetical protein
MSLIRGALQPGLSVVKKTAPFYSAVDEALAAIKRPKGTGAEFYTELTKQAGVKKAELADRKLEQAFKAKGKMTKEEAQQVLKDNPPPKLQEKTFTEPMDDYERDEALRDNMERFGYESWEDVPPRIMRQWNEELDENVEKYGDYRTAGGKNYREILLKLPESFTKNDFNRLLTLEAEQRRGELTTAQLKEMVDLQAKKQTGPSNYISGHWKEDPNVLAHMRVQDRTGPNGEKILHVEEIQSDWHQEGRKKGYGPKLEEQYRAYYTTPDGQQVDIGFGKTPAEVERMTQAAGWNTMPVKIETEKTVRQIGQGVPDAPFKKNWHELAMKRLLNYAADNGYDSIAITPGAEQAKRFNLRNQVDELLYKQNEDGTYQLSAQKNGRGDLLGERVPVEKLEDYVGKEVAQRIVDNAGTERNLGGSGSVSQPKDVWGSLSGEGLEVGGAGMIGFYDKMLPDYLNTYGKQYGAKVDLMPVDVGGFKVNRDNYPLPYRLESATSPDIISRFATPEEAWAEAQRRGSLAVHNFPITPEMRESIKQKGLPLYQQVGIPTAGAGAASQMLEPEEEPQYGTGGGVAKSAIKQAQLAKLAKMRQEMAPRAEAIKALIARDQNRYLADVVPNSLTNPEIEAEIRRMAARAKASGQQEGVLPLAQREANKAKYLEKSKEKNVMYHGTDEDISEFRPYTFVTPDPKVADQYPGGGEPAGQNIMPVHVRAENPFDYEIPSHIHKLSSIIKDKQLLKDIKDGYWQSIESPDVLEAIQKLGFDSFYSPDMAKNLGVFKPEQIKSAIGNRGTYDINEPEVNKAKGGLASQEPKYGPGGAIAKMALKAAPAPKAPQIIKPSTLTELKRIVEKEKGGYGARRVERAADEVPNLEKMYTLDALKERFTGDNAKALMTMSPADFEKFATELQGKTSVGPKAAESAKQGEISKYTVPTNEYVKHLERIAMFDSVPYLNLAKEEVGLPLLPYVSGHEGRHRSRALAGKGEKRNLVGVTPTMDLREGLPRRSQEEFIEAMKKELELSGGLVLPQSEPMMGGRPPIILPDVYAKGGAVKPKVKDAKSGKVTMTKNRDTMFMELSNKKLKRK